MFMIRSPKMGPSPTMWLGVCIGEALEGRGSLRSPRMVKASWEPIKMPCVHSSGWTRTFPRESGPRVKAGVLEVPPRLTRNDQ